MPRNAGAPRSTKGRGLHYINHPLEQRASICMTSSLRAAHSGLGNEIRHTRISVSDGSSHRSRCHNTAVSGGTPTGTIGFIFLTLCFCYPYFHTVMASVRRQFAVLFTTDRRAGTHPALLPYKGEPLPPIVKARAGRPELLEAPDCEWWPRGSREADERRTRGG